MFGDKFAEAVRSASIPAPHVMAAECWSYQSSPATGDVNIAPAGPAISFGPFRLLPDQRLLLEGDRPLRLGSRALEILVALVERAGDLVSKGELMARVWPDTFVEEANLRVQVAALRRALRDGENGNRYITTVAGRGYWFVAPVVLSTEINPASDREDPAQTPPPVRL